MVAVEAGGCKSARTWVWNNSAPGQVHLNPFGKADNQKPYAIPHTNDRSQMLLLAKMSRLCLYFSSP